MNTPTTVGATAVTSSAPRSLQARLLSTVLTLVVVVWIVAGGLTWRDAHHEVNELLDAHLAQIAALLLIQPLEELQDEDLNLAPDVHKHQQRVVFQVWHDGRLLARSTNSPPSPLAQHPGPGFSDSNAGGRSWRVFVTQGQHSGLWLQVGELQSTRHDVVMASLYSMIGPMLLMLPLLALGIWWVVRGSVQPLRQLGQVVATRQPQSLAPLETTRVPPEVLPLVDALNGLFERMGHLLAAEQQFTADASHELRTPIAAIRMQAQVAQGATQSIERNHALAATVQGCDRATRLIEQLLQLARLDAESANATAITTDLAEVARAVAHDFEYAAQARRQNLVLNIAKPTLIPLGEPLARVLLRNLLDNALRYSPNGAQVRVEVGFSAQGAPQLCVEDSGPGLEPTEMARLGERFFRVPGTGQTGSGLGWSIVQRIVRLYGLQVASDRCPILGGLRICITWP